MRPNIAKVHVYADRLFILTSKYYDPRFGMLPPRRCSSPNMLRVRAILDQRILTNEV
jgi:hypothetical protein